MSKIVFRDGLSWGNLPQARRVQLADLTDVETALDQLRGEWSEATGGDLSSVTVDLGALFGDLHSILRGRHESTD